MKKNRLFWILFLLLVTFIPAVLVGQVTNFLVNGVDTGAQARQGEIISWQYNLSVGGSAQVEIWVDVDTNKILDPAIDFAAFKFLQADGGEGDDGPPDMDGAANGQVFVQLPNGLGVAYYIMTVTENGVADSADFRILPLLNPRYTIFGQITDETGGGVPWVPVGAFQDNDQIMPNFWYAFSDSSGNYVINMDSTAGLFQDPWHVEIEESFLVNLIVDKKDSAISVTGNHGPVNFVLEQPKMYVAGTVLDQFGAPLPVEIGAWAWNQNLQRNRNADVKPDGSYTIGFGDDDTGEWDVGLWSETFGQQYLEPMSQRITLSAVGDSIVHNFTVYAVDDTIWGMVVANGDPIVGNIAVTAENQLAGRSRDTTDASGYFVIPVSSFGSVYDVHLEWNSEEQFRQAGFSPVPPYPVQAAPGDTVTLTFSNEPPPGGDLTINGMRTGAQTRPGETVNWHYSLPVAGTAHVEVWLDRDGNRNFDPQFDLQVLQFNQQDNGMGKDGPPDMDGAANGEISTQIPHGLAPGFYFMQVFVNDSPDMADFEVLPMINSVYSVFGQVLDSDNNGVPGQVVRMKNDDMQVLPNFWLSVTDDQGNFVFHTDSSAGFTASPWRVFVESREQEMFFEPPDTMLNITGDHGPIIFRQTSGEVVVYGLVADQNDAPLAGNFMVDAWNDERQIRYQQQVNPDGSFAFGFTPADYGHWEFRVLSEGWGLYMEPPSMFVNLPAGSDSVFLDFHSFTVDDTIWGQLVAGGDPIVSDMGVIAMNDTTGRSYGWTDTSGFFAIPVSSIGETYEIRLQPEAYESILQAGFYLSSPSPVNAAPGDTVAIIFSNEPVEFGNLLINGLAANVQSRQGEQLTWQFNLPVGSTANVAIWVDPDTNSVLDPAVDFPLFQFTQTDGQSESEGPPDMDGMMNGQIWVSIKNGLAPGCYFMRIFQNGLADTVAFKVMPLLNPAFSVFGRVTDESGVGVPWVMIQADKQGPSQMPVFWQAMTDSTGNYSINLDSSMAGIPDPWRISLVKETVRGFIPMRQDTVFQITGNHGPVDFVLATPQWLVTGTVVDQNGLPFPGNFDPYAWNDRLHFQREGWKADTLGTYFVGFLPQDTGCWDVGIWSDQFKGQYMEPVQQKICWPANEDTLHADFVVYETDAFVYGRITADGDPIVGHRRVNVQNDTTGFSDSFTDPTGLFVIPVSQVASQYEVWVDWEDAQQFQQAGYHPVNTEPLYAAPGDTVEIQFSKFSAVDKAQKTQPKTFSLLQNYPNPFNLHIADMTTVAFQIPKTAHVTISIYNLLGQEIVRLIDREMQVGQHQLHWSGKDRNGVNVGNGLYFIKMVAPNFTQLRKLMIVN